MARLVAGACVTDSKGLHDKMQHTMITLKGKERRVDIECLKEGLKLPQQSFGAQTGAQLGNNLTKDKDGTVCLLLQEWTTLESDI